MWSQERYAGSKLGCKQAVAHRLGQPRHRKTTGFLGESG
jgi:hypothetical protein